MGYLDRGDIKQELAVNTLSRGAKFDNLSSSDERIWALHWLLNEDPAKLNAYDPRLNQRYILAVLAFELEVPSSSSWLSSEHECTWYGIKCEEDDVVSLEFGTCGYLTSVYCSMFAHQFVMT